MSKISVIIPVYNVEPYLKECILSVLFQTYDDFEIVLVNDGSTDSSGMICDQFADQNPGRVKVIHQRNQGPLLSRIVGIREAKGDIIMFLDSDDTLQENALSIVGNCFQKTNCDMVFFDSGKCPNYPSLSILNALEENTIYKSEEKSIIFEKLITYEIPNSICLKAVKKECTQIDGYGEHFSHIKYGEDLLLSAGFISSSETIVYIKQGLYYYRARPGSAVHSFDLQRIESIKAVYSKLEKYINQWGGSELQDLYNIRIVNGWIAALVTLIKNIDVVSKSNFQCELKKMAEDSFFRTAYSKINLLRLSCNYRLLAYCLAKKHYLVLTILGKIYLIVQKKKSRRQYVR